MNSQPFYQRFNTVERARRSGLDKLYKRRKQSDQQWKDYKTAEAAYKKACRKAKEYDWEGFVEGQQNNDSINKLRKILEAM